jgi:DNA-binding GntR family transcriptional regulator
MTPPGTFERVYLAIRERLRGGVYRPGARLEPAILADELNASVTPVRDALHRLTGERLVEAPRHEGFRAPMMTETLLRQLYGWHFDLVMLAAMKHRAADLAAQTPIEEARSRASARERQNALFLALARDAGNPEHVWALRSLTERLEPAQRLEALFLDETESETAGILVALEANDRRMLRRTLVQYHRRRERIVPELLAGLLQSS